MGMSVLYGARLVAYSRAVLCGVRRGGTHD